MIPTEQMTVKEIAYTLRRSRSWVHSVKTAMRKAGIKWTMGMISLESFVAWVRINDFRSTNYYNRSKTKTP